MLITSGQMCVMNKASLVTWRELCVDMRRCKAMGFDYDAYVRHGSFKMDDLQKVFGSCYGGHDLELMKLNMLDAAEL